jgi:hypothetical protein
MVRKERHTGEGEAMRRISIARLITPDNLFAAVYLFLFAVILLSSDPEWLMWAGPITLGAFPSDIPPPLSFDPFETVRAAAGGALLGLLAFVILLAANGNPRPHGERLEKPGAQAALPGKP